MWINIVVLVVVFIVGPILCVFFSRSTGQKRAVLIAFAVLLVLWIAFFVAVQLLNLYTAVPFLALASLFLPIVMYFILMRVIAAKMSPEKVRQAASSKKSALELPEQEVALVAAQSIPISAVLESTVYESTLPVRPHKPAEPTSAPPAQPTQPAEPPQPTEPARPPYVPTYAASSTRPLKQERSKYEFEETTAYEPLAEPESAETREDLPTEFSAKTLQAFEEAPFDEAAPERVTELSAGVAVEPPADLLAEIPTELEEFVQDIGVGSDQEYVAFAAYAEPPLQAGLAESVKRESREAPEALAKQDLEAEPEPDGSEPKPAAAPQVERQASTAALSFEACFSKAETFAQKELWPVAARLYEESARLATTPETQQKALFAAMSAHIKRTSPQDAKRLVCILQEQNNLSVAGRIKLAAIVKMLG